MKVGIVSTYWPPHFGGGEKYAYNMTLGLVERGIDAIGITPTPYNPERDNGIPELTIRLGEEVHLTDSRGMNAWFDNHLIPHIDNGEYDIIIVNNCRVHFQYWKKLVDACHQRNIVCGVIHHDLGKKNRQRLEDIYRRVKDWEVAAEEVLEEQRKLWDCDSIFNDDSVFYHTIDSPLYFGFDFVIGNTSWSNRFIDVAEVKPKFVLHPILELPHHEQTLGSGDITLKNVNLTMLNPLYHKGRSYMSDIINDFTHKWTYRVLLGSYGHQHNATFLKMIEDSWPNQQGRVEVLQYVKNIYSAYENTDIFLFPSRYEGYGMAAVEPMLIGTPVIAHDYPSIMEAVGEGAYIIKWGSDSGEWYDAVEEILFDREEWIQKAKVRGEFLLKRQEQEQDDLVSFLEEQLDTQTHVQ